MNIIADTNLLIRAIIADDEAAASVARMRIKECRTITIPSIVFCEFSWVATRTYKSPRHAVASTIRDLLLDPKIVCDRPAVEAGLAVADHGGDFADGVIAFEGRRLGGKVFATFDRRAASLLSAQGYAVDFLAAAP